MSTKLVRIWARAAHHGALAVLLLTGACQSDASSTPLDELAVQADELLAPPALYVAEHPQYAELSKGLDAEIASIVERVASLPPGQAGTLRDELRDCLRREEPQSCLPLLDALDISRVRFRALADAAHTLSSDLEVETAPLAVLQRLFMGAQLIDDPIGPRSELTVALLQSSGRPCDSECAEQLGYGLGVTKGTAMARLSQSDPTAGDNGGGGGGGGGGGSSAGTAVVIISTVIEVLTWIEDLWWNSDEEDKACLNDGDCPSSQYCHTVGDNDCRDKLDDGELCSRSGQCESDRCRVHISCAFMPCCRP